MYKMPATGFTQSSLAHSGRPGAAARAGAGGPGAAAALKIHKNMSKSTKFTVINKYRHPQAL